MRRNVIVRALTGLVGSALLLILLTSGGSASAQGGDGQADAPPAAEVSAATPLTSAFTYQGQLKNGGAVVNGSCDMTFRLYDASTDSGLIGTPITAIVPVTNGLFTADLDFGAAFNGDARWLDIQVRCPSGSGAFTQLAPRQQVTAAPYALFSAAPWVTSGSSLTYNAGSVGIGTTTPGAGITLDVNGATRVTPGGSGGEIALAGPNGETGMTIKGANRADVRYDGTSLKLVAGTGTGPPAAASGIAIVNGGNVGIGTTTPAHHLSISGGPAWTSNGWAGAVELSNASAIGWQANSSGQRFGLGHTNGGLAFFRTASNPGTTASPATYDMFINDGGNVGIGTTTPADTLDVNGGIKGNSFTAPANLFLNASTGRIALRTTDGGPYAERMTILANGNVGIRNSNPTSALTVTGPDNDTDTIAFNVLNANGVSSFRVYDDGGVGINYPYAYFNTTANLCMSPDAKHLLIPCSSAAEYVPSVEGEDGYPETADLVSLAPNGNNPYGDTHSPFVVQKSAVSCDANLLGFIVNPRSGASGRKLNEHYLPLAIYGYFPAKVTLENGPIKRGDPITSSSRPGYGMKATQACKIIGYALEDADQEGTIQVFANHGEVAAPEVAALRTQVQELKNQNATLDVRLNALEQKISELMK